MPRTSSHLANCPVPRLTRAICTLLLTLLCLPLAAPALASIHIGNSVSGNSAASQSSLPACCRRDGAHHCAMSPSERAAFTAAALKQRTISSPIQPCPYRTQALAPPAAHPFTPALTRSSSASLLYSQPTGLPQTQSRLRLASARSRHKRGPPAFRS